MCIYSVMYFENGKWKTKQITGETRMKTLNQVSDFAHSIGRTVNEIIMFDDTAKHQNAQLLCQSQDMP